MAKDKSKNSEPEPSSITYMAVGIAVGLLILVGGYLLWSGILTADEEEEPADVSTIRYESPASESDLRLKILDKLETDTESWETYRNEEFNLTFRYPSGWSVEDGSVEAQALQGGESTTIDLGRLSVSNGEYSFRIYAIDTGTSDDYCVDAATLSFTSELDDYIYTGTDYTFIIGQSGDYYVTTELKDDDNDVTLVRFCLDEMLLGEFTNKLPAGKPISANYPTGNPNPEQLIEMYTIIATYAEIEDSRGILITPNDVTP